MTIMTVSTLSPREDSFCLAIVEGLSESDAYRKAYRPQRAKAKTIHEMASRLMAKRKVRARLTELMQPVIERAQLSRKEWLESLARICLADVRKMFDLRGNPLPVTELESNEAAAVAAFEVYGGLAACSDVSEVGGRMLRVRMIDQLKALELYGKAMGYFGDRGETAGYNAAARNITVEFVDPPAELPPPETETPLPEKPRIIGPCGSSALTY
jgi:Phage terminase, small subunit